jgi:hypothetical protein
MALPSDALKALTTAADVIGPALKAIELFQPLLAPAADYIAGHDVELPQELPAQLKSDIELARLEALAAKAT